VSGTRKKCVGGKHAAQVLHELYSPHDYAYKNTTDKATRLQAGPKFFSLVLAMKLFLSRAFYDSLLQKIKGLRSPAEGHQIAEYKH
jgi:hypothetical protein